MTGIEERISTKLLLDIESAKEPELRSIAVANYLRFMEAVSIRLAMGGPPTGDSGEEA